MWIQKPPPGTPLMPGHPHLDGLAGWWLFQEGSGDKVFDLSGKGNTGTLGGFDFPSTVASGWNPGPAGRALIFDGTDDEINCGSGDSFDITNSISVMVWVRPDSAIDNKKIIARTRNNNDEGFELFSHGDNTFGFDISNTAGFGNNDRINTDLTFIIGQWYHVAGVWDGTNIKIFFNGIEKSAVASFGLRNSSKAVRIGRDDQGGNVAAGIDDVRYYTRALLQPEIQDIMMNPFEAFYRERISKIGLEIPTIIYRRDRVRYHNV